jgi:phosphatidylserine/phosphatidylglycerophosphate/cardiolipin synthase-like enzyme
VITSSYNFTNSVERDNDENLVIVENPDLARLYRRAAIAYAQAQPLVRCR